jgi:ubiquinone/menaquinone biosynthesis C-methylase UbiE
MTNQPDDRTGLEFGDAIAIERVADELSVVHTLLDLDAKDILELGCGRAEKSRALAKAGADRRILALEVDEIQHAKNRQLEAPENVRFGLGAAEAIPCPAESFDVVFLFKSLHHVPVKAMDRAFSEIERVLRPGGSVCIAEPLFRGEYNEILRIFHDESHVRRAAFAAIERAVRSGKFELVVQNFFLSPVRFAGFDEFERLVVRATHSNHVLSDAIHEQVRSAFARHEQAHGASFEQPIRVDLLRKPRG